MCSYFFRIRTAPVTCILISFILSALPAHPDDFSTPTALANVTVVIKPGTELSAATILIEDGRIVEVGTDLALPVDTEIMDGSGLYAYAGFIDAATHLGIRDERPDEATLARLLDDEYPVQEGPRTSMQKANRMGVWPHLGPDYFYVGDEKATAEHRIAGFTTALVTPHADILSGYGDLIQLSGAPLRSATLVQGLTQSAGFGDLSSVSYGTARTYPGSPMGAVALLRQTYMDGEWYRKQHALAREHPGKVNRPVFDPVLEAMGRLLDRNQMWLFHANTPNEIHHALDLAIEFDQRVAIVGGKEAWKVAERLAEEEVPVIVSLDWPEEPKLAPKKKKADDINRYATKSWTPEWEDDFYEPLGVREERVREWKDLVDNLNTLMNAGVTVALSSKDLKSPDELFKNAKKALELGLTPDQLLTSLTTGPATLFDMEKQIGTIESGKLANLTILTNPLGEKDAQVRQVYIDGIPFTFNTNGKDEGDKEDSDDPDESDEDDSNGEDKGAAPDIKHAWDSETQADRAQPFRTNGNLLLKNARILTVSNNLPPDLNGMIHNSDILVVNGKIRDIGKSLVAPVGTKAIDLTGYWVSPGIIDPHSHIAVTGINEFTQSISSEVRQSDVVDHTALSIHRALAGGVTTIHTMHGSANSMGGQNAVLKLKYMTSPMDMLVVSGPRIVKFALGENVTRSRSIPRFPNSRMGVESVMRHAFNAAIDYQQERQDYIQALMQGMVRNVHRQDLRLEAISDILAGDIWVHSHCYRGDEILRLLQVATDYGFRIATLQHVLEGYRVAPEMVNHGVGGSTFSDWWSYKKEAYDAIPYNAAMMMRTGVVTSLNSDSAEVIRHLNLEAGKTMRFGGLTAEEAMRLITINPAIQLGLDNRIGSIEVGKDGDFAVFTKHPLDTHSRNVMTIIEGEVFFKEDDLAIDGSTPGPDNHNVPQPPRGVLDIPADSSGKVYVIQNATIHPVTSPTLIDSTIVINSLTGNIQEIIQGAWGGSGNFELIDGTGLHVYPGLINASTQMGLSEISGLAQTVDTNELATFQPELRALSAVNPHSEHIPVSLCEGITLSHSIPSGGIISGQGSAIQMSGWSLPEMLRVAETGLVINLPVLPINLDKEKRSERIESHQKKIEKLETFMRKAKHYADTKEDNEKKSAKHSPGSNDPVRHRRQTHLFQGEYL